MKNWDRIEALCKAQRTYEEIRKQALQRFGPRLCDFGYANAHGGPPSHVMESLREAVENDRALGLQYTPYGGATLTRRIVGQDLSKKTGLTFRFHQIVMTPGAMSALNLLLRMVADGDRDEVLVIRPCWLDTPLYIENLGLKTRFVDLDADFDLDLEAIREGLTEKTGAVVLSQPANPTGRVYGAAKLEGLSQLLKDAGEPLLISDECHRDIYWGEEPATPASFYPRTCIAYSFGKRFFIQGQRIGYAAVPPDFPDAEAFCEKLALLMRVMGFCTPTALMQRAVIQMLRESPDLEFIAARKRHVLGELGERYGLIPSDATFFTYGRTLGREDFEFTQLLADRGVLVLPSIMFHHAGHFRISLTASDEMFERGIGILSEIGNELGN
jgi:aspartate aminotransferase